ncbi:hypothetical protein NEUTE1DRAFT_84701 [Neurospora tetrasperma FGSC 2508]|uniref:NB-ARC domain-containing protein n=1 Tax=Neurospora tetrasperma (strain FGSC 2508 / ATCC MYA-4615 / P0657) TaxID=510951 RepID=F8MNX6_NEUT8|nr:uncharacterized protein NEUTE1DRAFT_84701 [Neurospora tetrasperma FGSC 2508]EGO57041.1 hypothetical protein NEUTE1DRAFT_84701 [Neurospora tetrasperma FGSC 2508]EGZ70049.1 hypothetical protein NEUTE2DRAFT_112516 [Neurospora tetrasperma FGSC 2509]
MSTNQSGDGGIDHNTVNGRVAGHNVMVGSISAVNGGHNVVSYGDYHFYASSAPNEVRKSVEPFAQLYFPRNEDFIERPYITEWLEKTLKNPGSRAALWGLGGIGKSQFAIRYAQDVKHRSPETFIFWIYARTRDLFITGYREIAEKLGLLPDPSQPDDTVLRAVRDWCRQNKQWLMILDNADDVAIFKNTTTSGDSASEDGSAIKAQPLSEFLPCGQTGNLLVTSRDKAAAHFLAGHRNAREVPAMTEHEAIQLLRKKLGDYNDEDCEVALVQALDCIPLAITQAASYIAFEADTGLTTPATYLELFRMSDQERVSLLSEVTVDDPFREPGTSPAVVTTWKITFSRIKETNANAAWLLSLMSFFHNQGIPHWILEKIYALLFEQDAGRALPKDLSLLCRYSLVTRFQIQDGDRKERHGATFRSQQYQMHALVQACTRAWLEESREKEDVQRHYINSLGVFHPDPCFESWTECGELSPHVESLLNLPGLEHLDKDRAPFLLRMLSCAGNYNIETGRLDRAMILLTKALHVAEKTFCPGHYYIFRAVGDLWKLRDLFGKHHSLQIKIKGLLARFVNTLDFVAKYAEKETISRALLHRRFQFPDEDWLLGKAGMSEGDIWIAISQAMLAQWKTEELLNVLEQRRSQLEMPDADGSFQYPAHVASICSLVKQGKWEDAEKSCRKLLEYYERTFGSQVPLLLGVRMHIVSCLASQGKHMEAVEELDNIVQLRKKLLGPEHPDTLEAIVKLAHCLNELGRHAQAEELLLDCLTTLEKNHEDKIGSKIYCLAIKTLSNSILAQEKFESKSPEFWRKIMIGFIPFVFGDELDLDEDEDIGEDESPAELSATEGTARALVPALPNAISPGAAISNLAHSYNSTDAAYQANLQDWEENAAARAVEQLHVGERMVVRDNTSRPEMKRLFSIGLGERRSLHAERALEDCMRMPMEVKKGAGEDLNKDRSDVRGDEDEVEEDVE